jgi:hypothetical protein
MVATVPGIGLRNSPQKSNQYGQLLDAFEHANVGCVDTQHRAWMRETVYLPGGARANIQ